MNQKAKKLRSPLGSARPHESALRHVNGMAKYVDDIEPSRHELVGMTLMSPVACGTIKALDVSVAKTVKGVHGRLRRWH